jgi:hypothetical protein
VDETGRQVWECELRLGRLLLDGDLAALERLCDPEFWHRAGREELAMLAEHAADATVLGVLGRRALLLVSTPAGRYHRYVVEQQWTEPGGPPLVEDQRLFTLADRAQVEASGDRERLALLRTKLAAQDAARHYAELLAAGDEQSVVALWSSRFEQAQGAELRPRIGLVRSAELIGSVGPRTLIRCLLVAGEETVELLWREHDGGWLVEGARTFRPPESMGTVRA